MNIQPKLTTQRLVLRPFHYVENRTLYMNGHKREVCVYQRSLKERKHDLHS